jgi:hypothetical protein
MCERRHVGITGADMAIAMAQLGVSASSQAARRLRHNMPGVEAVKRFKAGFQT